MNWSGGNVRSTPSRAFLLLVHLSRIEPFGRSHRPRRRRPVRQRQGAGRPDRGNAAGAEQPAARRPGLVASPLRGAHHLLGHRPPPNRRWRRCVSARCSQNGHTIAMRTSAYDRRRGDHVSACEGRAVLRTAVPGRRHRGGGTDRRRDPGLPGDRERSRAAASSAGWASARMRDDGRRRAAAGVHDTVRDGMTVAPLRPREPLVSPAGALSPVVVAPEVLVLGGGPAGLSGRGGGRRTTWRTGRCSSRGPGPTSVPVEPLGGLGPEGLAGRRKARS